MQSSNITWTQAAMNSLYGCSPAGSIGCAECYATRNLVRFAANQILNADGRFNDLAITKEVHGELVRSLTGRILFNPAHLYSALKDKIPKRVFVNEFSDLLHPALPLRVIVEHFRVFAAAPQHQFQVLTKRSERLPEVNDAVLQEMGTWPSNVWMGVSVCSNADCEFDRIRNLGRTAAVLRWVSFEPWISNRTTPLRKSHPNLRSLLLGNRINWMVVGGESGGREETRLMTLDDARYLIEEGNAAGCRVFFKQLGTALAIRLGVYSTRGKGEHRSQGGHLDQWPDDLCIQEYPETSAAEAPSTMQFSPEFDKSAVTHFE